MVTPMQPKILRAIVEFLVVGICTLALAFTCLGMCDLLLTGNGAGERDFVSYWAAGHLIAQHQNPYDSETILRIERSVGLEPNVREVIMRNPPSALLLVLPLSLFGVKTGALVWSLLLLACLVTSVRMLWIMHGRPKNRLHLLGYTFGPALACILAGQTAVFALLGLVLFFRFNAVKPFMAGVSLWLCLLKPHLFLQFGAVLLLWVIVNKAYSVFLGAAAAVATSSTIALLLDPHVWIQYWTMMRTWGIERELIPCLSVTLRFLIKPDAIWIQYLPSMIAGVWALKYFLRRSATWNWMKHGSLLMLVSVMAAPYAWSTDEAILVPAILSGAYVARSGSLIALPALASAAIEIEILFKAPLHSRLFLWTAPVWLAWYLYAIRSTAAEPGGTFDAPPFAGVREVTL
jgi:hypothetical protein